MNRISLLLPLLLLLVVSCQPDPVSPAIIVNPGGLNIVLEDGNIVEFTIDSYAGDADLRRVEVTEKPIGGITSVVLDTVITGQVSNIIWVYELPIGEDDVALTFNCYDTDGMRGQTIRRVTAAGNQFLPESTGHHLYSYYSGTSPNAFNLTDSAPLFLSNDPDSIMVDLVEFDELDDSAPSGIITSRSGILFTRNNSFNYAEATQIAAAASFNASTPLQLMSDLQVDDILITEYDTLNNIFAVIKITDIQDIGGSDEDRYTFNLKK